MKITEEILRYLGWEERDGYMYLPGNPRMGWWPDGRLVVGWWDYPERVREMGLLRDIIDTVWHG